MKKGEQKAELPLDGILVVDLTRLLPGPLCSMLLGDYGAEIIKVEDTEAGDPTRFVGPLVKGSGSFFHLLNRNKKSLALNLKNKAGSEILKKLAARADILVEGFRPGVMKRLGLDYEALKKINARLIYVSISGYGQEGPYRLKAGHDINYCALSGLLSLSAARGEQPVMPAVQIADIAGGSLTSLNGILMALYRREKTGEGCFVDVSMTRALLPWLSYAASALGNEELYPRRGSGHITGAFACYNLYETADGKTMSLGALEPVFWQRFCEAVGRPEWIPLQFDFQAAAELIGDVKTMFKSKSRKEWEINLKEIDVCCEPVLEIEEAIKHPLSVEGDYWISNSGTSPDEVFKQPGFPLLLNSQGGEIRLPPPEHGEHTAIILEKLGYKPIDIEHLLSEGLIKIK